MTKYRIFLIICAVVVAGAALVQASETVEIAVVDREGVPVYGASVMAVAGDSIIAAAPTDTSGTARLKIPELVAEEFAIRVSAVGFEPVEVRGEYDDVVAVVLSSRSVELGSVRVRSERETVTAATKIAAEDIDRHARASLVHTNPMSAVKEPEVVREGSSHSSKLRIHGSSPQYSVNGIGIGNNPNHFGVFSFIPASVLDQVTVQKQGTGASVGAPAAVSFETKRTFEQDFKAEVSLSVIEGTGVWSVGGKRWYLLGALRKSVLDKLVNEFNVDSERKTIPPTNFQDVFVSGGLRVRPGTQLLIDHYSVRDYLSYRTDPTSNNAYGTNTALAGRERYTGAQLEFLLSDVMLTVRGALRDGEAVYNAVPVTHLKAVEPLVNLNASERTWQTAGEGKMLFGDWQLDIGLQSDFSSVRNLDLQQQHWNFLPPDANSDRPFVYQPELNEIYGQAHLSREWSEHAGWISVGTGFGPLSFESGLRLHYFADLQNGTLPVVRQAVSLRTGENSKLRLFYGTFAESPVTKIMEPYQVPVRIDYDGLSPVRTQLVSGEFRVSGLTLGGFHKRIRNVPVFNPDFEQVDEYGMVTEGFLRMEASGQQTFTGGSVSFEKRELLGGRLDIYSYYGYTAATRSTEGVETAYEFNAPHRFFARGDYQLSSVITLGAELAVRSGYAYTPADAYEDLPADQRYTESYYLEALAQQNSVRFPMHAGLNLNVNFDLGATDLYLAVSNVTNRGNPIVSTRDGYIYDAGVLPSIGVTTRF